MVSAWRQYTFLIARTALRLLSAAQARRNSLQGRYNGISHQDRKTASWVAPRPFSDWISRGRRCENYLQARPVAGSVRNQPRHARGHPYKVLLNWRIDPNLERDRFRKGANWACLWVVSWRFGDRSRGRTWRETVLKSRRKTVIKLVTGFRRQWLRSAPVTRWTRQCRDSVPSGKDSKDRIMKGVQARRFAWLKALAVILLKA